MTFDKPINVALAISVGCHCLLILQVPNMRLYLSPRPVHKLEVSYYQLKSTSKALPQVEESAQLKKLAEEKLAATEKTKAQAKDSLVKTEPPRKEIAKPIPEEEPPVEKDVVNIKKADLQNKEFPSEVPSHLAEDPAYLGYYKSVRERIEQIANQNRPKSFAEGEVYLSFVVLSDGSLKAIRLIEQKSSGNSRLRNIAVRSIRESSPFMPFPKAIDLPQLSFNLVISYQKDR